MGSYSVTCHQTQVNTPCLNSSQRPILDLLTTEGWKAELNQVTGYIPRWFTRPQTVTHLSTGSVRPGVELQSVDHKSHALITTLPMRIYKKAF